MARSVALMLLLLLLKSFLEESEGAGGWTEVKDPDMPEYRGLARFAYKNQRRYWSPRLTFLVTQARWRITEGKEQNLAFVVFYGDLQAWLPWTTGVCINGQCTMLKGRIYDVM
ncbi:uncharacterized protein LOC119165797 isoform X2 [Rhipicephalus microplus]|uniref:uncharacterized protein LOC119165797 isoform X2 n=1 Tax=Rhipicephalus microplus TaxID=6941 RepID=UPI003F6B6879